MAWETVKRVRKCKNQRVSIRLYCILLPYYTIHIWLPYSKDKSGKIVHWVPLLPLVTYNVFLPHLEKFDLQNLICSLTKLLGILGIGLIGIGSISGICFLFVPNIYDNYQTVGSFTPNLNTYNAITFFSFLLIQLKNMSFPPNSSFYFQEFTSVRFQPLLSEVISSISRLQVSPISLVIAFLFAIHICLDISQGFPSLEKWM